MKQNYLRDQRGVAVLLELVLVAAVLTLAGLALYQASHRPKSDSLASTSSAAPSATNTPPTSVGVTPSTAIGLAASAAAISEQASATDASLSASAENSTAQLGQTDTDVTNLQGSSNANF